MRKVIICDAGHPDVAVPFCCQYGFGIEVQAFYDPMLLQRDTQAVQTSLPVVYGNGLPAAGPLFESPCGNSGMVKNDEQTE